MAAEDGEEEMLWLSLLRGDVGELGLPEHAGARVPVQGDCQASILRPVDQP